MPRLAMLICLVAATAAAPAQPDWGEAIEVDVRLTSFAFAPRTIQLPAGRPVRLRLVNTSGTTHDFSARDFFARSRVQSADRARIASGTIVVPAHSSTEVMVVPSAGSYRLKCGRSLHKMLGMAGTIVVE